MFVILLVFIMINLLVTQLKIVFLFYILDVIDWRNVKCNDEPHSTLDYENTWSCKGVSCIKQKNLEEK